MKVRDIMTPNPRSAEPDTTLEEIATIMKEEDVGAVPVVEDGRVIGMVTDRDIVVRCLAEGNDPPECTAEDIMSEEVKSIAPDTEVDEAARIMGDAQIRRLAVVKGGKLVGMLSLGDLAVKAGEEEEEETVEALEEISQGVKAAGGNGRRRGAQREDFDEETELEMTGSARREGARGDRGRSDRAASRSNWNQGDREAERAGRDDRRVVAGTREGGRGERPEREESEGRMQQRVIGRGTQQPAARGRDRRGRVQQTGETRRTSERGRPEKVGHGEEGVSMRRAPRGPQGISNRAAGREGARQAKVAPRRAEAGGSRQPKRRAS